MEFKTKNFTIMNRYTSIEFVTLEHGRAKYIESISDLPDDALIAKVRVIRDKKSNREISRDQFVNNWITVKEYYNSL